MRGVVVGAATGFAGTAVCGGALSGDRSVPLSVSSFFCLLVSLSSWWVHRLSAQAAGALSVCLLSLSDRVVVLFALVAIRLRPCEKSSSFLFPHQCAS